MGRRDDERVAFDGGQVTETMDVSPGMGIDRYLSKHPKDESMGDMLKVLFRGKIMTEAEWTEKTDAIMNRKVK